jgi:hypothetical protein
LFRELERSARTRVESRFPSRGASSPQPLHTGWASHCTPGWSNTRWLAPSPCFQDGCPYLAPGLSRSSSSRSWCVDSPGCPRDCLPLVTTPLYVTVLRPAHQTASTQERRRRKKRKKHPDLQLHELRAVRALIPQHDHPVVAPLIVSSAQLAHHLRQCDK